MNLIDLILIEEFTNPPKPKQKEPAIRKLDLMTPRVKEVIATDVDDMTILRCDGQVTWYLDFNGHEMQVDGYDLYPGTYISRHMDRVMMSNRSQQGYVVVAFNIGPGMWPGHARFREVVTR